MLPSSEQRVPSARARAGIGTRRGVLAGRPRSRAPGKEGTAERSDARGGRKICVTAPKQGFGQDASTGVKHGCGAGGCTYVVPRGSAGCNLAVCVKSCPSPKYLLTAGPLGLGCAE